MSTIEQLANSKFRRGLVQWTRYGDEDFGNASGWLAQRLYQWSHHAVLWLGLYADPDYFQRIHTEPSEQIRYLAELMALNDAQIDAWKPWIDSHRNNLLGFYLPMELSDYYFPSQRHREVLRNALIEFREGKKTPLSISLFISNTISPDIMHEWLEELRSLGYQVWLQDGSGTRALSHEQRAHYLDTLDCSMGIIQEAFVQIQANPFKARSATQNELSKAEKLIKPCHPRYYFSLRYLPQGRAFLDYH